MTNNNITETVDMPLEMFKDLFVATVEETKEDNVCTFCNHQYLTGKSPEIPVKLHCGHIFGVRCLTRKLVRNKNFNRCSACNLLISVKNEQREEKHTLVEGLKDNSPRQPVDGGPLKGAELLWAEKAEHLWKNMCDDMIRYVLLMTYKSGLLYLQTHLIHQQHNDCHTSPSLVPKPIVLLLVAFHFTPIAAY